MKKSKKRAILGLSFGVIFSILLIIFFVMIAFIAINAFLNTRDCAKLGIFLSNFQSDVDKAWNAQRDEFDFKGDLPRNLDFVCFYNFNKDPRGAFDYIGHDIGVFEGTDDNFYFYPTENACSIPRHNIKHMDIEGMTRNQNPFCVKIDRGLLRLKVIKDFNDRFVTIAAG